VSGDDVEPIDLEPIDVEPIDLEPIDLEPIDLESDDRNDDAPRPNGARLRRNQVLFGLIVAGLAAWGAIALSGRSHGHPESRGQAPQPPAVTQTDDGQSPLVRTLEVALERYWPGATAAVIDGRLYVIHSGRARASLVMPEDQPVIEDQSGSSLLISTFPEELVTTQPAIRTSVLSPHSIAIRATTPGHWWLLSDDRTLRDTIDGTVLHEPLGLRVAAAVPRGFVALDAPHMRWVLWSSGASITPIVPSNAQLVAARGEIVVFRTGCSINGCPLELYDLAQGSMIGTYLPGVPDFAAFSPDGTRLALASTLGDVFLVDPSTGQVIDRTRSRVSPSLSQPFTWSPDGGNLLVVQEDSIEVHRAVDGATTDVIPGTEGLEQLAALP